MRPRFLLDEHVNRAIQRQLRRLDPGIGVLAINDPDAPPAGTSDPDILQPKSIVEIGSDDGENTRNIGLEPESFFRPFYLSSTED